MILDLHNNSTVVGKKIENNFIQVKHGKIDNLKKFPFVILEKSQQKQAKSTKNNNTLLVDTDNIKNLNNMKLRPFSAKNNVARVTPTVYKREQ